MSFEGPEPRRPSRRRQAVLYFLVLDLLVAGAMLLRSPLAVWRPSGQPAPAATGFSATRVFVPVVPQSEQSPRAPKPRPTATLGPIPQPPPLTGGSPVQAKIEIVWPHDGATWANADLANITVYLFQEDGLVSVPCSVDPVVRLWRAEDTQPARPVAIGQKRMLTGGGRTWPVWDFNDVDVSPARDPAGRLKFFATVDGLPTRHNVWVHGADSRTVFPRADEPVGVTAQRPAAVDARIEILWPHDDLPPEQARTANLTAYLFDAGTGRGLAPGIAWQPVVRLHWSLNNDADEGGASSASGIPRTVVSSNGLAFLAWDFNDVDVTPALDSLNKMHFWITVDDTPTLSNVWTHGAVAATMYPQADVPQSCE